MDVRRRQFFGNASLFCGGALAGAALPTVSASPQSSSLDKLASVVEFGAKGDGLHDDHAAFSRALASGQPLYLPPGTYFLSDHVKPPAGGKVILIGAHRDLVTVLSKPGKICIYCDAAPGIDNRISGAHIEGITFDGRHQRGTFPYTGETESKGSASMSQALNLRGAKGEDEAHVVITRCRFKNINGLPVWIADFSGSVEFSYNHLSRCRDPGFLLNDDLKISGNTIEFSADNGISVSRSNKRIAVYGNHIRECAVAGIFIGGVDLVQKDNALEISGADYSAGQTLTLTAGKDVFDSETVGFNLTLRQGSQVAVLRCIAVKSKRQALALALLDLPANMRNQTVREWSIGPIAGAQYGQVFANVIEGTLGAGININQGCKGLHVFDNVILRTGICADSECATQGSLLAGQNEIRVKDSTGFNAGDWLLIEPDYADVPTLVSQIVSVSAYGLRIAAAADVSYIDAVVRRAGSRGGRFAISVVGSFTSPQFNVYAENVNIHDNTLQDFLSGGIRLGSKSGAARKVTVHHNMLQALAAAPAPVHGILVDDGENAGMPVERIYITDNMIETRAKDTPISLKLAKKDGADSVLAERNYLTTLP